MEKMYTLRQTQLLSARELRSNMEGGLSMFLCDNNEHFQCRFLPRIFFKPTFMQYLLWANHTALDTDTLMYTHVLLNLDVVPVILYYSRLTLRNIVPIDNSG